MAKKQQSGVRVLFLPANKNITSQLFLASFILAGGSVTGRVFPEEIEEFRAFVHAKLTTSGLEPVFSVEMIFNTSLVLAVIAIICFGLIWLNALNVMAMFYLGWYFLLASGIYLFGFAIAFLPAPFPYFHALLVAVVAIVGGFAVFYSASSTYYRDTRNVPAVVAEFCFLIIFYGSFIYKLLESAVRSHS